VNQNKAILAIIVGLVGITLGLTINQFYASNMYGRLGRPIARWQRRLLFAGIGTVFLVVGIAYFFSEH
jgi:hypothetical protein